MALLFEPQRPAVAITRVIHLPVAVTSVLRDRSPKPPEVVPPPASYRWGKPSNFSYTNETTPETSQNDPLLIRPRETINPPDPDPDPDPSYEKVHTWVEIEREVKRRRVTQDSNPENWIDFDDATSITFQAPDEGKFKVFYVLQFQEMGNGS